MRERYKLPEVKEKIKKYNQMPEVRAKQRIRMRNYMRTYIGPKMKAFIRKYGRLPTDIIKDITDKK